MVSPHEWHVDGINLPDYVEGGYGIWEADDAMRTFENNFTRLMGSVTFEARTAE
jgi:hypothetical protein